jgi:hypothetical protein
MFELMESLGEVIGKGAEATEGIVESAGEHAEGLGTVGSVAELAVGANKMLTGDKPGDLVGGVSDIAKGTFGLVCGGAESSLGEAAGPIGGAVGGVLDMGTGAYDMVENSEQMNQGAFFNDEGGRNEFWGGAGEATLGAMHTAISAGALLGPEALPIVAGLNGALSLGEGALSAAGMGAGIAGELVGAATGTEHNWWFGANDVVGAGEHALYSAQTTLGSNVMNGGPGALAAGGVGMGIGGALGMAATAATGGLAAPLIPMLAAGGGALASSVEASGVGGTLDAIKGWF